MKLGALSFLAACALLGLQGCDFREVTTVRSPQAPQQAQQAPLPQQAPQAQLPPPPSAPPPVAVVPEQQPPAPVDPQVATGAAPPASAATDAQDSAAATAPPETSAMGAQPAGPQGTAAMTEMGELMAGIDAANAGMASPDEPVSQAPAPDGVAANLPAVRNTGDPEGARLLAQRPLLVPVAGVQPASLTDQYELARGSRVHEAIDIVAPRGTPVLAVDEGRVAKLFSSRAGGLTVYQFDPGQRLAYYYAHLDRYAGGLREGMDLRRGDVIGYVGSSGNAAANVPHLHFAVFRLGNPPRWWEGEAVNPYPALSRAMPAQQLAGS